MRFSKAPSPCFTPHMFHPCAEMCEKHRCDFIPVTVHWRGRGAWGRGWCCWGGGVWMKKYKEEVYIKAGILEDSTRQLHNVHTTETRFSEIILPQRRIQAKLKNSHLNAFLISFFPPLNSCKPTRHVISFFWSASVLVFPHTPVKIFFSA